MGLYTLGRYKLARRKQGWGIWDNATKKWHTKPGIQSRADCKEDIRSLNARH